MHTFISVMIDCHRLRTTVHVSPTLDNTDNIIMTLSPSPSLNRFQCAPDLDLGKECFVRGRNGTLRDPKSVRCRDYQTSSNGTRGLVSNSIVETSQEGLGKDGPLSTVVWIDIQGHLAFNEKPLTPIVPVTPLSEDREKLPLCTHSDKTPTLHPRTTGDLPTRPETDVPSPRVRSCTGGSWDSGEVFKLVSDREERTDGGCRVLGRTLPSTEVDEMSVDVDSKGTRHH